MREDVSALMDGDLEPEALRRVLKSMCSSDELRSTWTVYHLIGDCMRNEGTRDEALTQRIMAALHDEPTVLAPQARKPSLVVRFGLAAAASVLTVSSVAWITYQGQRALVPVQVALPQSQPASSVGEGGMLAAQPASLDMSDYVWAHRDVFPAAAVRSGSAIPASATK